MFVVFDEEVYIYIMASWKNNSGEHFFFRIKF